MRRIALAKRPLSRSVPLPGSSALASRTTRLPAVQIEAARTCSSVPPPNGAASAEKSMPIGTSIPAIVVPARNSTGSQASRSSRLAASAMSSRWCRRDPQRHRPIRRRAADLQGQIVDRRERRC